MKFSKISENVMDDSFFLDPLLREPAKILDSSVNNPSFDKAKTGKKSRNKRKIKTARVDLVIEPNALELIKAVAEARGCSMSSFMVIEATKAAEEYMAKHNNDLNCFRLLNSK